MSDVKLMKPLFCGGNFNTDGKRMKAIFMGEVCNGVDTYRLWRGFEAPDRTYPRAENDTHLLYVEAGGYLAPLGMTECDLIDRCGYPLAIAELYGSEDGRRKYFQDLREAGQADAGGIPRALQAEHVAIQRLGRGSVHQADYIKKRMDEHITVYLAAKETGGESFPDFIGAAALHELELCKELAGRHRAKRRAEAAARKAEIEAAEKKEREKTNLEAQRKMQHAIHVLQNGGKLENEQIRLYREDGSLGKYAMINHLMRQYGVSVPLRTQGWINEKLLSVSVENRHCTGLRYMRAKGGRCSQKFFVCLNELIQKVCAGSEAVA